MFRAKVYKLGKSGRLAMMIPKDIILEIGEYEIEPKKVGNEIKQEIPNSPIVNPETTTEPQSVPAKNPVIERISQIIAYHFPEAKSQIQDRGSDYAIEITIKEGDVRSFVADKPTATIEVENWCRKIKANLEGKSLNAVAGTNLMTGMKAEMKKMPPNITGSDAEFFFRE